ncbi:MAG: hypothetical protein JWN92_3112, partial [Candidatus Acidoferrum typicum]|nr:hypothetical protein [Candidatus Acidoferrum typicum]
EVVAAKPQGRNLYVVFAELSTRDGIACLWRCGIARHDFTCVSMQLWEV